MTTTSGIFSSAAFKNLHFPALEDTTPQDNYWEDHFDISSCLFGARRDKPKKGNLAEQRFAALFDDVQSLLNTPETLHLDPTHLKYQLRPALFALEGLYRLYKKRDGIFEDGLVRVKELEDTIGAYDFSNKLLKAANELGLSDDVIRHLEDNKKSKGSILEQLLSQKWLGDNGTNTFQGLKKDIEQFKFKKAKKELKFIRKTVAKEALKTAENELDMSDMENGVHEYRRDLRWFSMYLTSIQGGVYLDDSVHPISELKSLLDDEIANMPYANLNESNLVKGAIALPKSVYFGVIHDVKYVGDLKDLGENVEGLAAALVATGEANDMHDAEVQLLKLYGKPATHLDDISREVEQIFRRHQDIGLLEVYADAFSK